ncbi:hypothetical protein A1O1_09140 [Capronia coronata CBS 617.96]|uniref:BZIP domain-containing protein n=1 Tax=Capronia coronata CBS 617.96 TaxID=1182541 RepID=W9XET0_9EURO|nr:uncharacterized protein A1O1_09140 [Capronia coronata CBS 617.96]EXJ78738.1 hypothetical protein A1O1_09140 [Capronia coronata CBS 617.96]
MSIRASYFKAAMDSGSSLSNSPDLANEMLSFSLQNPLEWGTNWGPIDLEAFTEPWECDRSAAKSVTSTDSDNAVIPGSKIRRRAQNRASQRAFRERKERHVKGLEYQLETLNEKHQDLLESYTKQSDIATKLNQHVAQLQTEIKALKLRNEQDLLFHGPSTQSLSPESFDAFSFTAAPDPMLYDGNEEEFSQAQPSYIGPESERVTTPPIFEDILHVS